jgi:tetratricopeptide (TPR) repeat protein
MRMTPPMTRLITTSVRGRTLAYLTRLLVPCLALALTASVARAEDCPSEVPQSSSARRALAKEWFNRADTAEAANDPVTALKAYQCSLKIVPHAFTAYNLARLAEKTGDLELAVEAYGKYLNLAPEAQDRNEVETKMTTLSARIAASRSDTTAPAQPSATPTPEPTTGDAKPEPPRRQERDTELPPALDDSASTRKHGVSPAVYVVGVVGVAALAGGIVLNLGARTKMDDCYSLVDTQPQTAKEACDAAKPRAYGSYALFGVAAAAAVADAILLFAWSGEDSSRSHVSLAVNPDGATLLGRFRF